MHRTIRFVCLAALAAFLLTAAAPSFAGDDPSALSDPRVAQVMAMAEGGLSHDLVLAKVEDIGAFPELSGPDLVALKQAGVPEDILIRMIELEKAPAPAPAGGPLPAAAPAPAAHTTPPAPQPGEPSVDAEQPAHLKVVIERPFRITYYEVAVDGEVLAHRGKLWEGRSEMGQRLKRPSRIGKRQDTVIEALDTDIEPGTHQIAVGFAVTWVEDDADQNDDWGETAHEFYVNRGVRAVDDGHPGEWGPQHPIECTVAAGETCTVIATVEKRAPTKFGGIPVFSVSYRLEQ